MASWHGRDARGALLLLVHAQPGARRTEVVGLHGDALKVRVAAPALEDRANEALIAFFAQAFDVPRRNVTLAAGAHSREKRFVIEGSSVAPAALLGDG